MKKVVLYIGGFILPDGNAAAQRVLSNAKILNKLSYEVVFLGTTKKPVSKNIIDTYECIEGFSSYKENYPLNIIQWLTYLISIKKIKRIINEIGVVKLDTIIAYNYPSFALYLLNIFCQKNKIKLVSDSTEWAVDSSKTSIHSILKNIDTYARMRLVHPKLDGLIAISDYLFEYYSQKMKNVIYVPPLVDISQEKWKNGNFESKSLISLVYAGSPGNGSKDRIDKVINGLSKLKLELGTLFKLVIVGITLEEYFFNFKKENLPVNIEKDIIFKGRISHINAIKEIQKADFSIFFRENNLVTKAGFPTKFVESITCGAPVLTNESSNIVDYLTDSKLGIIMNIDSEEKLVASLKVVMSMPRDQISEMKKYCLDSRIFDYLNYVEVFKTLLVNINLSKKTKII